MASSVAQRCGSAAVLFNGIKESWRLARKIPFLALTVIREVIRNPHISRHSPLGNSRKTFAAGSAEQLNSPTAESFRLNDLND